MKAFNTNPNVDNITVTDICLVKDMESNISSEGLQPILLQSGIHYQTFRTSEMHFENIGFAACLTCLTAIGVNSNLFMVDLILFFVYILKQL